MKYPNLNLRPNFLDRFFLESIYWFVFGALVGLVIGGWMFELMNLITVCIVSFILMIYGGFVEPQLIEIKKWKIGLSDAPSAALRVVFLADLHAGCFKGEAFFKRVASYVEKLKPDIILLGGDIVDGKVEAMGQLKCFKNLSAKKGKYFVLGGHDFFDNPEKVAQVLTLYGFTDVTNRVISISVHDRVCNLIGLDDPWFGLPTPSIIDSAKDGARILLAHEADALIDLAHGSVDIAFTGHTHGGQVRLPFLGSVMRLPQHSPQSLDEGLRSWKNIRLLISRGLGETGTRVRFFARPQIVCADIKF